ncbi:MAG: hypothetical protein NTZ09_17470 [Candidatus Hydrogenedentes bacterium]|nr:hypothetical protein [Candidatus Hydrogenedentota bacterium]
MAMLKKSAVVAVYPIQTGAEAAVTELQHAGFDMKGLSIVGKDYRTDTARARARGNTRRGSSKKREHPEEKICLRFEEIRPYM